jgi:hypothetical protein
VALGFTDDARHHGDGFDGILADGRLAGEHDGVSAVVDGVGHVGDLGARGPRILDHRFQHLRGRDHGLGVLGGAADDVLLNGGNLLRRHFHAQIAARHHDAVGHLQNGVEMLDGLRLFQLGDDPGVAAEGGHAIAHQAHVFGGAHKGDGDGVDAVLERELQVFGSFSVSEGVRTRTPGRLMPLFSPSMPPLTMSQTTSSPLTSCTRSSMRPSESRMREPCSTFSASVLKVVPTSDAVPGTSRGVMVRRGRP